MKKLYVYADFDWLNGPVLVGELGCENVRGSLSYSFKYDNEWLGSYAGMILSEDIRNYPGMQYTQPGRDVFGCFSDALPDRWGRTLLERREQILAKEEGRPVARLTSLDMLMGIEDQSRMGGLRFSESMDMNFINVTDRLSVPPIVNLRELIAASQAIEEAEEKGVLPEKRWLDQLYDPGTSLGGARPKSNVADEEGCLNIAKFPSRNDAGDVGLWEHFAHLMAAKAGIDAAHTRVMKVASPYSTLLSKRFDRTADGRRIHFASAMTLLGFCDGDNAHNGKGYLDIAEFIIRGCTDVERNLRELYRRVAFNICIGNSDDHFRNHGFLLTSKGWTLSPAYDMNPSLSRHQSLMISKDSNNADLDILLNASDDYFIPGNDAESIIHEVRASMTGWQKTARRLGLPERDIALFEERIICDV